MPTIWLSYIHRGWLIKGISNIGIPILGTLIWACPNLIIGKIITTKNAIHILIVNVSTKYQSKLLNRSRNMAQKLNQ